MMRGEAVALALCLSLFLLNLDVALGDDLNKGPQPLSVNISSHGIKKPKGALEISREVALKYEGEIPKLIHQVYGLFSPPKSLPSSVRRSINSFKSLNPDWTHVLWGHQDVNDLIESHFPALNQSFHEIRIPVLKADLVRYLVLYLFGGVYSDVDVTALRPMKAWTYNWGPSEARAVIGIEADTSKIREWWKAYARRLQFCQWTFMSVPGHPLFADAVYKSMNRLRNFEAARAASKPWRPLVMNTTGPGVFTDAVADYLKAKRVRYQDLFNLEAPRLIGDVVVLPLTGFSPGVGHMGSKQIGHPDAMVFHGFKGSWRNQADVETKT